MSKPAVVFGGPSPEHDISVITGLQATHVLGDVHAVYWDKTGRFHLIEPDSEPGDLADGVPRKARELSLVAEPGAGFTLKKKPLDPSVVVVCCHGGPGEDGTLQGVFDLCGYRYTGPGQAGSALGMDKLAFGAAVAQAGLPTLPRELVGPESRPGFDAPYIVKPRFGGSSIGIEIVDDVETARDLIEASPHFADGAVIEPFLAGFRDLQVAVRTYPALEVSAIEEPLRSEGGLYSYRQKYLAWGEGGAVARKLPAPVSKDLEAELERAARAVAGLVRVRGVARIDFLEDDGKLWVNEINTIPGSLAAYLWIDPEIGRGQLLADMIAEAATREPRRFSVAGADGTALRSAGTLAGKLG